MYTDREAFDAMRLFYERRADPPFFSNAGELDPAAWREWKDCLRMATQGEIIIEQTADPKDLVEEMIFHAEDYAGGLPPICPVCQAELGAPHPECRDKVIKWMKLLR